jgi:hypothetical protein
MPPITRVEMWIQQSMLTLWKRDYGIFNAPTKGEE